MDELFGNSSSDTVMEAELSQVLANINQDIADLQYLQLQQETQHHEQPIPKKTPPVVLPTQLPSGTTDVSYSVKHSLNTIKMVPQLSPKHIQKEDSVLVGQSVMSTPKTPVAHVPVITSVGKRQVSNAGPVPQPRYMNESAAPVGSGTLRHTQSAVVGRQSQYTSPRPRALSTSTTTHPQQHQQPNQHFEQSKTQTQEQHKNQQVHSYVNVEPLHRHHLKLSQKPEDRPLSEYDNVPQGNTQMTSSVTHISQSVTSFHLVNFSSQSAASIPRPVTPVPPLSAPPVLHDSPALMRTTHSSVKPSAPQYMNVPLPSDLSTSGCWNNLDVLAGRGSNSAPSTPRRGDTQRLHHSYIELWSGLKEERDSLSDSECEELKRSFQEPQTPSHRPAPGYVEMSSPYIKSPQVASPFNGSVLANLASKLATYAGHQPRNIFCPFCPRYFGYEKSLGSHIHKVHREELNTMVENPPGQAQIQFCPICQAKFFNTSVLPKHLIDFHRASVVEVLEKNNCIMSDAAGIQCPFCVKKVPHGKTGEQVLLYHMQQLHLSDFEDMIRKKFKTYSSDNNREALKSLSSTDVSQIISFNPGLTSTPGLSGKLGTMKLSTDARRSVEALDLDDTWSSHRGKFKSPMPPPPLDDAKEPSEQNKENENQQNKLPTSVSKGILRHQSGVTRKASVKRELRFSVPPVTSEEVFIPESPEQSTPERQSEQQCQPNYQIQSQPHQVHQQQNQPEARVNGSERVIPIRVDSLSAADFLDLNQKAGGQRKRRRLGLGLRSRKAFKKRDKENISELGTFVSGAAKIVDGAKKFITESSHTEVIPTPATRTFRRPRPVPIPRVPELPPVSSTAPCRNSQGISPNEDCPIVENKEDNGSEVSPFSNLKLYSPLRMFRCNTCRVKFCDNESLSNHISSRHRGLLSLLRPQYGCGVCSAKFYENKYLVKHCLQHHTSLLEIRSPRKHKIAIYRFAQD